MATNGAFGQQDQYKSSAEQYPTTSGLSETTMSTNTSNGDLSKDEVGWYFVEQYYTTLSRSHEKLHLFYGKHSQFVSGLEAEIAQVSVGRSAIQERIKSLDLQDCKVRVTNVDSQASGESIIIQVIGETSNKSAVLKKFVQTFVLAKQPNGYFVLNDIIRYINDEEDEQVEPVQAEEAAVEQVKQPEAQAEVVEVPTAAEPMVEALLDIETVQKKLEESIDTEPTSLKNDTGVNGEAVADEAEVIEAEDAPVAALTSEDTPTPEVVEQSLDEEASKEVEKPKDPVPTPAISRGNSVTKPETEAQPTQPAAPPKPKSWATLVAASAGPQSKGTIPAAKAVAMPAAPQSRAAPEAPPVTPKPVATPVETSLADNTNQAQGAGWQTADHTKRHNRPQSISSPIDNSNTLGYVRHVTASVDPAELKARLATFGEVMYFDANRGKNCAFVEFKDAAGYQAAVAANPHHIGGEGVIVEPRRPKASAFGGSNYPGPKNTGGRGTMTGNGERPPYEQGRPNSQGGARGGGFGAGRGRGIPRGRGLSSMGNP